jgi:hypothetical protein
MIMRVMVLATLALLQGSAMAADWVEIERTSNKIIMLDTDSIKYSNPKKTQRQAWVKFIMLDNSEYKKGDYILGLNNFNCTSGAVKFNDVLHFGSNGELKSKTNESAQGWQNLPSESLFSYVGQTVCSYPHLN